MDGGIMIFRMRRCIEWTVGRPSCTAMGCIYASTGVPCEYVMLVRNVCSVSPMLQHVLVAVAGVSRTENAGTCTSVA